MKICITNFGIKESMQQGPYLSGNLLLHDDSELFENESRYHTGAKTCLNFLLLNPIPVSELLRLEKNDNILQANVCANIIDENVIPRESILKISTLTPMELEVLSLVPKYKTTEDLAKALHVSYDTITTHLDHIYSKIGLHTKVSAYMAYFLFMAQNPEWAYNNSCHVKSRL